MTDPTPKQIAVGCRFFNGIHHNHCEAGIAYAQFLGKNYDMFPCHPKPNGRLTGACSHFEFQTMEEIEQHDKETAQAIAEFFTSLADNKCPHCGAKIERKKQVGRCVYSESCGHRLYQGKLKKGE